MKRILIPTDFSSNARVALEFAIKLAKKTGSRLTLFNAFQTPVAIAEIPYEVMKEMVGDKKSETIEKLKTESELIKNANVDFEYHAEEGEALDALLNYTRTHHFDYIIAGAKGAGNRLASLFGSTVSRLMSKTNVPVIAIPEKTSIEHEIHKITFATNYNITDVDAIAQLTFLATAFNAQLHVLHVCDSRSTAAGNSRMMDEFAAKVKNETDYKNLSFQILPGNNSADCLKQYINAGDTDMIVMSTHLRSAIERIFSGSLTKHIELTTPIPMVVYHHQKETILN